MVESGKAVFPLKQSLDTVTRSGRRDDEYKNTCSQQTDSVMFEFSQASPRDSAGKLLLIFSKVLSSS